MISLNCEDKDQDETCERTFNVPENFQIDIIYNSGCKINIINQKIDIKLTSCNKQKKNVCFVNLINKNKFDNVEKTRNGLLFLDESNEPELAVDSICRGKLDCSNPACYC